MTRWMVFLSILPMTACGIDVRSRPALRWTGPLVPTTSSDRCPQTRAVLILRGGIFTFTPDEGTWLLEGAADGEILAAKRSRPTPDHKLYVGELKARWTQTAVHGTYTTPFCDYAVDLSSF